MKNKRIPLLIILLQIIIIVFASCSTIAGIIRSTQEPTETASPQVSDDNSFQLVYTNPLTGMDSERELIKLRPIAVMMNNLYEAQPQLGISKADIIYEIPVEGGITRMMALFQDPSSVAVIGSIRSARHYYLDIAQCYDAVYIHAGGSPIAYDEIVNRGITNIDGVNGRRTDIFYRDDSRAESMGYEHSMVTSGGLLSAYLPSYDIQLNHPSGYFAGLYFTDDGTPQDGREAKSVTVNFNNSKSTWFSYDTEIGKYLAGQYDGDYTDGNDETQVSVTNIIVLKAEMEVIDDEGRLDIKLTGSGDGYFFCGGKYVPLTWSRRTYDSQFTYTTKEGRELVLGRGQSYVCIIPITGSVDIGETSE